jgi:hypothetical protein
MKKNIFVLICVAVFCFEAAAAPPPRSDNATGAPAPQSENKSAGDVADGVKTFDAPVPAEIISEKAFVREDHDNSAKRVVTLEEGDSLHLLAQWDGGDEYPWYWTMTGEAEGWIYGQNLQRLDGKSQAASASANGTEKKSLPSPGIMSSNGDFVIVVATGQGTDRTSALERAWIDAVRLAVGAIISSKSELNNDDFAENTIAHSRGVIESFELLDEQNDGKRTTVTIQAMVHKEILSEATKTYAEAQTVKASAEGAIKAQLNVKANESTAEDKQKSGMELLREVLESYTPDMFYSATLDPEIKFNKETKRPYIQITQKFNQDIFWKEFIPRLHKALEGVAEKKEKRFYNDAVRQANQNLSKEGFAEYLGTYSSGGDNFAYRDEQNNFKVVKDSNGNFIYPNPIAPYSWYDPSKQWDGYSIPYPGIGISPNDQSGDLTAIVPESNSAYVVYTLPCKVKFSRDLEAKDISNLELYDVFYDYLNKMTAPVAFSIAYMDSNGEEIHTQIIRLGSRMLTVYRSFYGGFGGAYERINFVFAYAPGYVGGDKLNLYLGSANYDKKYDSGWYVELDENDLQRLDSMKFEVVFENQ